MQEVTIKKDNNIKLDSEIKIFLNPKFVFLPIKEDYKLKVRDGDYVYKNDIVAMNREGKVICSSVSGKVLGLKKMNYYNIGEIPSIVIENDFKENLKSRKSVKQYISEYSFKDIKRILEDTSYTYKGKYVAKKFEESRDEIIINGVEVDPYFSNKYFILRDKTEDILEMSDMIGNLLKAKKMYLVVKNTDSELINKLTSLIGTYPNIELKLISGSYPNGMSEIQKRILKMPNAIVFDVVEVLDIFRILKREKPITTKLITITGSAVKPCASIEVKIGTLLSEVFVHNFDFIYPKVDVYINGTLYGDLVDSLKFIVDSSIDGIFIQEKSEHISEPCMNCGQCSKTCPVGLNPKYVFDHDGTVKSEYYDKCIHCGLCNYVCPANRDLKSKMKGCVR